MVVLVVLAAAAALGGWLSTSGSSPTPAGGGATTGGRAEATRLVSGSLAAAAAAGSFHYVSSSVSAGISQLTVGDAGAVSGRQVITVAGDTFTVLVVGSTAYFQGDATAMVQNLAVPPAVAQARAGQWISLVSGDSPYESVKAAVTTSEALSDNVTFTPRTVLAQSAVAGQRVIGVRGAMHGVAGQRGSGTAILYVSAGGRHLPVRYVEHGTLTGTDGSTASITFTIDFSAWGEGVQVNVPPGAVAFSSLGVSGAPGQGSPPTTLIT